MLLLLTEAELQHAVMLSPSKRPPGVNPGPSILFFLFKSPVEPSFEGWRLQERYVRAAAADTARTVLFDQLGPIPWPNGVDGRIITNRFTDANPEDLLANVSTLLTTVLKKHSTWLTCRVLLTCRCSPGPAAS
jgi:hypothetical protein